MDTRHGERFEERFTAPVGGEGDKVTMQDIEDCGACAVHAVETFLVCVRRGMARLSFASSCEWQLDVSSNGGGRLRLTMLSQVARVVVVVVRCSAVVGRGPHGM